MLACLLARVLTCSLHYFFSLHHIAVFLPDLVSDCLTFFLPYARFVLWSSFVMAFPSVVVLLSSYCLSVWRSYCLILLYYFLTCSLCFFLAFLFCLGSLSAVVCSLILCIFASYFFHMLLRHLRTHKPTHACAQVHIHICLLVHMYMHTQAPKHNHGCKAFSSPGHIPAFVLSDFRQDTSLAHRVTVLIWEHLPKSTVSPRAGRPRRHSRA